VTFNNSGYYIVTESPYKEVIMKMDELIKFDYFLLQDNGPVTPLPNYTCETYLQRSYGGIGLYVDNVSARSSYNGRKAVIIIEYTLKDEE
jgi:hypothetical protein